MSQEKPYSYSPTEVGTLVESLRSEFRVVTEGVSSLSVRMDRLESRFDGVENRLFVLESEMKAVKDVIRLNIGPLTARVSSLELKVYND